MSWGVYVDPHVLCTHRRYKMTCEEYDGLRAQTGDACSLCHAVPFRLVLDHDHSLGSWAVRGLVCDKCNALLRDVDQGKREATEDVRRYFERAWHLSQPESRASLTAITGRRHAPRTREFRLRKPRRATPAVYDSNAEIPPLAGAQEIQQMLGGVTRQRVQQIVNTKGFPDPVLELRMGKAWLRADVEAWIEARAARRRK